MPKLDQIQTFERLQARLADLKAGKEVAAREIRALLTPEQIIEMDAAWVEQHELRKKRRAKTKEEELALGWKTKREVHIDAYEKAISEIDLVEAFKKLQRDAEIRQMKIYMVSYGKAIDEGKDKTTAKNIANNDLTRAGLTRMDGQIVRHLSKRDREVNAMEMALLKSFEAEMTEDEFEQAEILRDHEQAVRSKRR
jgi:hypothetical protein